MYILPQEKKGGREWVQKETLHIFWEKKVENNK